jgi:hypothetical protein
MYPTGVVFKLFWFVFTVTGKAYQSFSYVSGKEAWCR